MNLENRISLAHNYGLHEFTIRDILGQGGFGITYLAEDNTLNRNVAIKEYLPMDMAVREADSSVRPVSRDMDQKYSCGLDKFVEEARTLARFRHNNIVQVYSVFTDNNTAYMVMEYERGESLAQILKREKTLSESVLLDILMPVLDGLGLVHECGYIHRDVKPANIFVREDGSPVLLDFGSARQSLQDQSRTLTTMISPGYAPFEQYTGKSANQGPWSDIYGLGATLYKAVTGRAPADAMDRGEALLQADRDIFVTLREIGPQGYTTEFIRAVDEALQFRPSMRPISVKAWRQMFKQERPMQRQIAGTMPFAGSPVPSYSPVSADHDDGVTVQRQEIGGYCHQGASG